MRAAHHILDRSYENISEDTSINAFGAKAVAPKYQPVDTLNHLWRTNRKDAIFVFSPAQARSLLPKYGNLEKQSGLKDEVIIDECLKIDAMRIG